MVIVKPTLALDGPKLASPSNSIPAVTVAVDGACVIVIGHEAIPAASVTSVHDCVPSLSVTGLPASGSPPTSVVSVPDSVTVSV